MQLTGKIGFEDRMSIRGVFRMRKYYRGILVEDYADSNLIVNGAKEVASQLIAGEGSGRYIAKIAFGTNGNIAVPDDTAITSPFTKNLAGFSYPAPGQAQFSWNLLGTEANGMDIFEFGLVCADGTLYARKVRSKVFSKDSDFALEGEWIILF
jgi:hypothetical protein